MNVLSLEKQVQVISALTEGCSIRSTERLTDVHRDTIMRLGVRVGEACRRLHNHKMRGLQVNLIELDEQWAFIGKKQGHVTAEDSQEMGDAYLFVALDVISKAVLAYVVGKRTGKNAQALATDLRGRIVNRPQITSDGFTPYVDAIDNAFGADVDFAQLIKLYQGDTRPDAAHRYSPGSIRGIQKKVIQGAPKEERISTSYVERFNLSTRMAVRRFTRLTNGFSKKLENHRAAIALHLGFYNFCRVHETLRITPAMALGVTDHIWTIGELVTRALETPAAPPTTPTPPTTLRPGTKLFRLRVIRGGKLSIPRRVS